ncbi:MAG: nucleoside kinase [Oscillospiraceae bacterium]|nr:nucleoside kinase [Oscillospiraceae bacterium]
MRVLSTETINAKLEAGQREFVAESEERYSRKLDLVAQSLIDNAAEKPVILLSGPSGSGKTSSAFRLRELLCERGFKTYTMSMDNYFIAMDDPRTVYEADGTVDFESPNRLESEQLAEHLEKMWFGETFTQPIFDFVNQKQIPGEQFRRGKNELVILEGIHALNPAVTGVVSEHSQGVYVSVRTRVKRGSGKLLHPSKIRLMRRLIRDKLFRGRETQWILNLFDTVQRGEEQYILPYKCYAEHHIDTFLPYELCVYKAFLKNENLGGHGGLIATLKDLFEMSADYVPQNSLTREFIGGSEYEY